MTAKRTMLEGNKLSIAFNGLKAVDDMTLHLHEGELLGLIGPNGAGKTTMFNMLAGALKPDDGSIVVSGQDVTNERVDKRIRRGVGRTFQIPRPFAEMTVLENVLSGNQKQSGENIFHTLFSPRRVAHEERDACDKAMELLEFVLLGKLAHEPARVLSGGQRKLLELARVLMSDPDVILLDEPAAGVNPSLLEVIIERIQTLNSRGKTILLIEHNMDMVARLCSRVVVMASGQELAQGSAGEVVVNPRVIQAYLGETA